MLSVVVYLNENWLDSNGGELVIYNDKSSDTAPTEERIITVKPSFGSIVVFLSEVFPHEVLPAQRDRYAIAG